MQKHLEEVLTNAGLPAEQVKALVDLPDDTKDFKVDDFVKPLHTTVETKVKNDPEFWKTLDEKNANPDFVKKIESQQYGRAATIVRTNILKAVGMSEKDFADLGEEGKKLEVFTPAFVKKLTDGKITDKELQAKLVEANTELEALRGQTPELEKKYKEQYEKQLSSDKQEFIVFAELAQIPGLKAPAKYISDKITAKLNQDYALVIVGNEAVIRQKSNPELKVLTDNNTKELTLRGAIEKVLDADNLIDRTDPKKKVTIDNGKVTLDVDGEQGGLKIAKHVNDKIAKRLEEEKAQK